MQLAYKYTELVLKNVLAIIQLVILIYLNKEIHVYAYTKKLQEVTFIIYKKIIFIDNINQD